MKYAFFLGCKIPATLPAYEASTRAVMEHLGVTLIDLDFNCCGYPARNVGRDAFVISAARNLALAEGAGLDVLTPCTCCQGALRHAIRFLTEDEQLRARVRPVLASEGLAWSGAAKVKHLLPVLADEIGSDAIAAAVRAPRVRLRVAAQYGCHALRPSDVAGFDNPLAPTGFEDLIRLTGAEPVEWSRRLDCCGDPLHEANSALAARMSTVKIASALDSGAEALCTACPHCHLQFEAVQSSTPAAAIRTMLLTQLLGLALGLSEEALGMSDAN
jgi:heterodisulfide reductase subunit B